MLALPDCAVDADDGDWRRPGGIAPEICSGIFVFAAAMHAGPGAECAGTDDGRAVRRLRAEGCIGGMGEAGEPGERFRRDKFGFAAQLHAADDGGQIDVAAALAGAEERALNLSGAGEDGSAGIGDAEAAIGVAMESEFSFGMGCGEAAEEPE